MKTRMVTSKLLAMCILALMLGFSPVANATLNDRGGGLIYDTDLDITWLQNAGLGGLRNWSNAVAWADALVYGGYDDWRLPTTVDGPYVWGYNGTTTGGYNITTSEMGYMYYVNLGNLGYYATDGTFSQPGWGLTNTDPFINLQPYFYWSGSEYSSNPDCRWGFIFGYGYQGPGNKVTSYCAWAVRPGDVVPEPATICLLGLGALSLLRRKTGA